MSQQFSRIAWIHYRRVIKHHSPPWWRWGRDSEVGALWIGWYTHSVGTTFHHWLGCSYCRLFGFDIPEGIGKKNDRRARGAQVAIGWRNPISCWQCRSNILGLIVQCIFAALVWLYSEPSLFLTEWPHIWSAECPVQIIPRRQISWKLYFAFLKTYVVITARCYSTTLVKPLDSL